MSEEPLSGGNAAGSVVRVGGTVRKPWLHTTERTATYLRALRGRGIDVPLLRGRDERGRQILDFIPGRLAMYDAPLDLGTIRRIEPWASMYTDFHGEHWARTAAYIREHEGVWRSAI